MDHIIHNAYEVLVKGHISIRERNGLKSSRTKGGVEDACPPIPSLRFPL